MNAVVDVTELHRQRQERLSSTMRAMNVSAILTSDPINILYATGSRNMTVFGLMGPSRFMLHCVDGPTILFEFNLGEHLAAGITTISEIRTSTAITAVSSPDFRQNSEKFANEVVGILSEVQGQNNLTLAVEFVDFTFTDALRKRRVNLSDGTSVFQQARMIKQPLEIDVMRHAIAEVEQATAELVSAIRPGATENQVWAEFHRGLIARNGEYVSTRLFQSGVRTFPYFQESSDSVMEAGDLVCLDTDALGVMNYAVDFSRTFVCGDVEATEIQRTLFGIALEQLEHNAANLAAGLSFEEFARNAFAVPEQYRDYGYYVLAHGIGMCGEYPNVPRMAPDGTYNFPGQIQENMVLCIESYVGDPDSHQGVKLEDQYLIHANSVERLTNFPLDSRLTAAERDNSRINLSSR
jgi:Xaa-Pro dipeptidase